MKQYRSLLLIFFLIWVFSTGILYLLGQILNRPSFQNIGYIILLGFSIAFFGIFGPILTDRIKKNK